MPAIFLNDKTCIRINRSSWVLTVLQKGADGGKPFWKEEKHLMSLQSAIQAAQHFGYVNEKSEQAAEMRQISYLADETLLFAEQGLGHLVKLYAAASAGLDAQWSALFDGPTLSAMTDKQLEEMAKAATDTDPEMLTLIQLAMTLRMVNGLRDGVIKSLIRE